MKKSETLRYIYLSYLNVSFVIRKKSFFTFPKKVNRTQSGSIQRNYHHGCVIFSLFCDICLLNLKRKTPDWIFGSNPSKVIYISILEINEKGQLVHLTSGYRCNGGVAILLFATKLNILILNIGNRFDLINRFNNLSFNVHFIFNDTNVKQL